MEITILFAVTLTVFFLFEILLLVINKIYNRVTLVKISTIEKQIKDADIYEIALLKRNHNDIFKIALCNLLQNDLINYDKTINTAPLSPTETALLQFENNSSTFCFKNLKLILVETHIDIIANKFYNHQIFKPIKTSYLSKLSKLGLINPLYKFWKIKLFIYLLPLFIEIIYFMNTKQDLSFFLEVVMLTVFMAIIFYLGLSNTNYLTLNGIKYCELFEIFKASYPNIDLDLAESINQHDIKYHLREI